MAHDATHAHDAEHDGHDEHEAHHYDYVKIWGILLVLLVVSIIGPEFGIKWVTLVTAFGIAFVKAYMVVRYFMHVTIVQPVIQYALVAALAFMAIYFAGVAPDVMKHEGQNWVNEAAIAEVERAQAAAAEGGDGHHDDGHGDDH